MNSSVDDGAILSSICGVSYCATINSFLINCEGFPPPTTHLQSSDTPWLVSGLVLIKALTCENVTCVTPETPLTQLAVPRWLQMSDQSTNVALHLVVEMAETSISWG